MAPSVRAYSRSGFASKDFSKTSAFVHPRNHLERRYSCRRVTTDRTKRSRQNTASENGRPPSLLSHRLCRHRPSHDFAATFAPGLHTGESGYAQGAASPQKHEYGGRKRFAIQRRRPGPMGGAELFFSDRLPSMHAFCSSRHSWASGHPAASAGKPDSGLHRRRDPRRPGFRCPPFSDQPALPVTLRPARRPCAERRSSDRAAW